MKARAKYELAESLGYLTTLFSRTILKRISEELPRRAVPICSEKWSLLVHVWAQGGQSQRELAERLVKDKTYMARLAADLEKSGLILRLAGQSDRREKMIFLTKQGAAVMGKATALVQGILDEATAGITAPELATCKHVLRRAQQNLVEPADTDGFKVQPVVDSRSAGPAGRARGHSAVKTI